MGNTKLLSIGVPSYNSQDFMHKCIDSLLTGGAEVEIIIVNDGSKDRTGEIADEYAARHPDIVRVVHQENGGYGAAVNAAMKAATGLFFKIVDSDDWVDSSALAKVLSTLKTLNDNGTLPDIFITNFIYDKVGARRKKVMRYHGALPEMMLLNWSDVGHLKKNQYILMHAITYRTEVLRDCGLALPHHTFYSDNLYVYIPMQYVKSLYYLDVDFYHYLIGREGQSVQEDIMISRIDQQLRVNKLMIDQSATVSISNKWQQRYLFSYLGIITLVSSILLVRGGEPEHYEKKEQLWSYIRSKDKSLYRRLRYSTFGILAHTPGQISVPLYKAANKVFGFN